MAACLEIPEFRLELRIGCTEAERARWQPIQFTIRAKRPEPFLATQTDQLSDTVDVSEICSLIRNKAVETQFSTMERLCGFLLQELKSHFKIHEIEWEITVHKIAVPIPGLTNGYRYVQSST